MSDKKNIERLFQERFKDFEVQPAPAAWDNIASRLEEKKDRKRVFPFWFNAKAAVVAAALVLGFFTVNNNKNVFEWKSNSTTNEVLVSDDKPKGSVKEINDIDQNLSTKENSNPITTQNNNSQTILNQTVPNSITSISEKRTQSKVNQTTSKEQFIPSSSKLNTDSKIAFQNTTANDPKIKVKRIADKDDVLNHELPQFKNNSNQNNFNTAEIYISNTDKQSISNQVTSNEQDASSLTKINIDSKIAFQNASSNDQKANDQKAFDNKNVSDDKLQQLKDKYFTSKNPIESLSSEENKDEKEIAFSEKQDDNSKEEQAKISPTFAEKKLIDSIVIAQVEVNPLEQILKEKEIVKKTEEEKTIAKTDSKWKIRPNFAPIFMNSSKGSSENEQIVDNGKKFENDLSIGLGVDYAISPKIAIRTGINKFEIGYNTYNVTNPSSLYGKANNGNTKVNATSRQAEGSSNMADENQSSVVAQQLAVQVQETGYINQKIGYLEVPMEISYKLLDKKIGIQFITGVSTLFLNSNNVSVNSSNPSTVLAEANNLNKVHFSTNIGLGFKYGFWKSFEANFEPTFKYQLNTFSEKQGSYKPYIIGLYTGLSYKF